MVFTPTQLDAYGEAELNTLADLLYADGPGLDEKFQAVAEAIARKIDHDRISAMNSLKTKHSWKPITAPPVPRWRRMHNGVVCARISLTVIVVRRPIQINQKMNKTWESH